jgi:hypothetical protein
MTRRTIIPTLAVLAATDLGACTTLLTSEPSVVSADMNTAVIGFEEGDLAAATARAQELCGMHARTARLDRVTPGLDNRRTASFACI